MRYCMRVPRNLSPMSFERRGYAPQEAESLTEESRLQKEIAALKEHGALSELMHARAALERNQAIWSVASSDARRAQGGPAGNVIAPADLIAKYHQRVLGGETPEQIAAMASKNVDTLRATLRVMEATMREVPQFVRLGAAERRLAEIRAEDRKAVDNARHAQEDRARGPVEVKKKAAHPGRQTLMGVDVRSMLTPEQRKALGLDQDDAP